MREAPMDKFCQTVHLSLWILFTLLPFCVREILNVQDHAFDEKKLGGFVAP